MFSASLQEILARYSDPSRNPYVQSRSQTSEPSSSQHLLQTPHPGLDVSFSIPSTYQWEPTLKLDIEAFDQPLRLLNSRGCYIEIPTRRIHPQRCAQQVLTMYDHADFVTTSRHTGEGLGTVLASTHDAATVIHNQCVPDVPQILSSQSHVPPRFWSKYESNSGATDEMTSVVPAPVGFDVQPSASGSHAADPVVIADVSDASSTSEISGLVMGVPTTEKDQRRTDKGEAESRRDAANREAEKLEIERMEIQKTESATKEAERPEVERMEMERHESVTKEAETKKEPRVSPAANAHKLLRMERKLNNKDLFMGWYKSANSAELRYPHDCIAPKIGDVYVHSCKKEGHPRFQLWVRQISRGMTIWVKAHIFHIHPKLLDRRLTLLTTGEPYWTTRHSLSASGNRERAGKIAEMIIY